VADAVLELAPGLRVAWDELATARERVATEGDPAWRIDPSSPIRDVAAVRVLTVATDAGDLLLLAGARPAGAPGHDAERPNAVLVRASGEVTVFEEALLSTQTRARGEVARTGLELYAQGEDYPVRGAGDTQVAFRSPSGVETALQAFRLDGEPARARFDVLRP
jgi:hypothetical protein